MAYTPFSNCLTRTVERKISFKGKYWELCRGGKNILLIERFSKTVWEGVNTAEELICLPGNGLVAQRAMLIFNFSSPRVPPLY